MQIFNFFRCKRAKPHVRKIHDMNYVSLAWKWAICVFGERVLCVIKWFGLAWFDLVIYWKLASKSVRIRWTPHTVTAIRIIAFLHTIKFKCVCTSITNSNNFNHSAAFSLLYDWKWYLIRDGNIISTIEEMAILIHRIILFRVLTLTYDLLWKEHCDVLAPLLVIIKHYLVFHI